jgi:hypothetical protein
VRITISTSSAVNTNSLPDVIILTAMGEETAIEAKEAPRGAN